jgi:ABC-type amino acid transport system permease subunit
MDWRLVVAGFVVGVGLVIGWWNTGTVRGAVFAAALLSALFVVSWVIDEYVYGL